MAPLTNGTNGGYLEEITGVSGGPGVGKLNSPKPHKQGPFQKGIKSMNGQKQQTRVKRMGWLACLVLLLVSTCAPAAQAQTRLIVRDSLGLPGINLTCLLAGCRVVTGLGDPNGQLFLVTLPALLNPITSLLQLNLQTGILDVEVDQTVNAVPAYANGDPSYLTDKTATSYYGSTVWHGYLAQPGNALVRTTQTQSAFNVTGAG